jgi:processive 1,2-diacylglycerol beta-glucosyltransferase
MDRVNLENLQAGITARFGRIRGLFAGVRNAFPHSLRTRLVRQTRPPGAAPRILLLTSTLGSGHVAATQAVESALLVRLPAATVCTLDFWSLMDPSVAHTIRNAYLRLAQEHPELYDNVYQLDQGLWRDLLESNRMPPAILTAAFDFFARACAESVPPELDGEHHESDRLLLNLLCSSLPGRAKSAPANSVLLRLGLIKWSWARLAHRLETRLLAFSPDAIVATQMAPAALLASIRKHRKLGIPTVSVPTDFGIHDFWARRGIDMYCVAHETVANLQSVEPSRVVVTGIPLKPGFRHPPSANQARAELGLDPNRPVVLVPGGGLGLGVDAVIANLLSGIPNAQLLALTASNAAARAALAPLTARYPSRLHTHGWIDRMEVFLRAADLVVGKPGGLTVAEALACGRPLFATRSLRGQEGFNVRFLEQHHVGCLVSDEQLVPRIVSMLADRAELARIQDRAWALGRRDGADRIADLVLATARQTAEAT